MAESESTEPGTDELLAVIRELVAELHPGHAPAALSLHSDLDRDVGLDSLGRVELMLRLQRHFGVRLSDEVAVSARTPADLLEAVGNAPAASAPDRSRSTAGKQTQTSATSSVPEHAETLNEALAHHARQAPERTHLIFLGEDDDDEQILTYGDLLSGARETATGMRARGLEPGRPVALMLPSGPDFFLAFHGTLLAGGVPVPMYPPFRPDQLEDHCRRLAAILQNAQITLFVASDQTRPAGRLLQGLVPELESVATVAELRAETAAVGDVRRQAHDLAFLQYTSGTTGTPKGVMLSHDNLLTNIRAMGGALAVDPENDVFVSWLPLYHDMGLIGACLGTLYYGMPLVLMSPLQFMTRPQRWLWAIHRHGGTISAGPNFAYDLCAGRIDDRDLAGLDLSSWRLAANGAEPVSARTLDRFCDRFADYGFRREAMTPVYGLAESSLGVGFPPLHRGPVIDRIRRTPFQKDGVAEPAADTDEDVLRVVACGSALPGHEVRIVDREDQPLADRREGRLQFRGPSCTRGYYRNEEATRELFAGDWLNSGDLAYMVDGEIHVSGRTKDLIIRAGRNISPYEIEQRVSAVEGIRKNNVAAFAVPDANGGPERLVIMAETRETDKNRLDALRKAVQTAATEALDHPPDDIALVPPGTVAKTSSGKIRRADCRAIYEQGTAGQGRSVVGQLLRLALASFLPAIRRAAGHAGRGLFMLWCWLLAITLGLPAMLVLIALPGRDIRAVFARVVCRALIALTGTPLTVHDPRDQQHRGGVIVANHASYLDGLVMRAVLRGPVRFVAKRELQRNPFIRLFLNRIGVAYVDRSDHRRGLADLEEINRFVQAGETVLFFPEGTLTTAAGLRDFRVGPFMIAARAGLPVLPVSLRGMRRILRGKSFRVRPGRVAVHFSAPLEPSGNDWNAALELRDRARAAILEHCGEPNLAGADRQVTGNL